MKLYAIPGLGADHRIYDKLHVDGVELVALDWPTMPDGASLKDYAAKLAAQVDTSTPYALVGVSMGGMVALEMAQLLQPKLTVLISSWKGPEEMPASIKAIGRLNATSLINEWTLRFSAPMLKFTLGGESKEDQSLLQDMLGSIPADQIRIGAEAILDWKGCVLPDKLVHIHGDSDRMMPLASIKDPTVVKGGTHFMVYDRAGEINEIIQSYFL